MVDSEIWLRSTLRRFGISRYLRPHRAALSLYYRRRYAAEHPSRVQVGFNGCRASMHVTNETEYVTIMGKKEDARFMRLLSRHLRAGDCFWDIGSNVGYYALLASKLVGAQGKVIAFEPEPRSRARLHENLAINGASNVEVVECALGRESGEFELEAATDPTAGVHRLVGNRRDRLGGGTRIRVSVKRGDDLAADLPRPSVVKIDVEGAELDVIEGMQHALRSPDCRGVFCEVHFGQLEARGTPLAPREIQARLRSFGFGEQRWVDASHLFATR